MSLRPPNLDDRDFDQLVQEANRYIQSACPDWTDLSPGDPGEVLVEAFAHLTEVMIYRLNQVPDKAYIEFLRLLGVRLQPPSAARALLTFNLAKPAERPVTIPRGTRVTAARAEGAGEPPVFTTAEAGEIPAGETSVQVTAFHCHLVEGEHAGYGTGQPGAFITAEQVPIVARTGQELDLVVGVEAQPDELRPDTPALEHGGKSFRIWQEVAHFANLGEQSRVYTVDRVAGTITFAPAVRMMSEEGLLDDARRGTVAEVPAQGREIRLWYRSGGGPDGNVAAHTLTVLKDPIPGVAVTNSQPASGGRATETLDNALKRGPKELHSLNRAVTAGDFELLAKTSSGAVARAKAFTMARQWVFAERGTVQVLLVPFIPENMRPEGRITGAALTDHQSRSAVEQIQSALDEKRPLGTTCRVDWARYKTVSVDCRIVVYAEEDRAAVQQRVLRRLNESITPAGGVMHGHAWDFGQPLRSWHIYEIVASESGVRYVDDLRLRVESAPDTDVVALAADPFQPYTWYAGTGATVFRSSNDGDSWEVVVELPDEELELITPLGREAIVGQEVAGLVAVVTRTPGGDAEARIHLSEDCGETWRTGPALDFRVEDAAWMVRKGTPVLLLATSVGLYELVPGDEEVPVQVLVDPGDKKLGFHAVAVSVDMRGAISVAVAAYNNRGVYLSTESGAPESFHHIGLDGELVRILEVQHRDVHAYLWAGIAAPGDEPGQGAFRWPLTGTPQSPGGWRPFTQGWQAGSCRSLSFLGSRVMAASLRSGVLWLDLEASDPQWQVPEVDSGLPLGDQRRLLSVDTTAANPEGDVLLAGASKGVYRTRDRGASYHHISQREATDKIMLPPTWLFCSGEHSVEVISEHEVGGD